MKSAFIAISLLLIITYSARADVRIYEVSVGGQECMRIDGEVCTEGGEDVREVYLDLSFRFSGTPNEEYGFYVANVADWQQGISAEGMKSSAFEQIVFRSEARCRIDLTRHHTPVDGVITYDIVLGDVVTDANVGAISLIGDKTGLDVMYSLGGLVERPEAGAYDSEAGYSNDATAMKIFPNPVKAGAGIGIAGGMICREKAGASETEISLYDIRGRRVASRVLGLGTELQGVFFEDTRLSAGVYLIRVKSGGEVVAAEKVTVLK